MLNIGRINEKKISFLLNEKKNYLKFYLKYFQKEKQNGKTIYSFNLLVFAEYRANDTFIILFEFKIKKATVFSFENYYLSKMK